MSLSFKLTITNIVILLVFFMLNNLHIFTVLHINVIEHRQEETLPAPVTVLMVNVLSVCLQCCYVTKIRATVVSSLTNLDRLGRYNRKSKGVNIKAC